VTGPLQVAPKSELKKQFESVENQFRCRR
jgi:hypothetical protein